MLPKNYTISFRSTNYTTRNTNIPHHIKVQSILNPKYKYTKPNYKLQLYKNLKYKHHESRVQSPGIRHLTCTIETKVHPGCGPSICIVDLEVKKFFKTYQHRSSFEYLDVSREEPKKKNGSYLNKRFPEYFI
jgi:hypothetical protein